MNNGYIIINNSLDNNVVAKQDFKNFLMDEGVHEGKSALGHSGGTQPQGDMWSPWMEATWWSQVLCGLRWTWWGNNSSNWGCILSQGASFVPSVNRKQGFLSTSFLYTLFILPYSPIYSLHPLPSHLGPNLRHTHLGLGKRCIILEPGGVWISCSGSRRGHPWVQIPAPPLCKWEISDKWLHLSFGLKFLTFKTGIRTLHEVDMGGSKITIHIQYLA